MEIENEFNDIDLKYTFFTDNDKEALYVKFTGFEDTDQINTFAKYLEDHLPLLLFNSSVKN
jgi:hypothetical protein